ncbi:MULTISPECIES: hypothetical protein [Xenorhabdus]|nr:MULTISPECIES: hypothetical protein [Xenorhabdus]MBC8945941.1 hypothetical protein [Xenorhabdus indica]
MKKLRVVICGDTFYVSDKEANLMSDNIVIGMDIAKHKSADFG